MAVQRLLLRFSDTCLLQNKYDYVDSADIDTSSAQVPGLALLILVTLAVLGTAVYVATQTANPAAVQ